MRISRCLLPLLGVFLVAGCSVPDDMLRAMAYGEIADIKFRNGDYTGARDAALLAVEVADNSPEGDNRMFTELAASIALLRAGHPGEALHRADMLPDPKNRLFPLTGLARAMAIDGLDQEAAFAAARIEELLADMPSSKKEEFAAMALLSRSAIGDFGQLPSKAAAFRDLDVRNGTLAIIAIDQAAASDFSGALTTAKLIADGPETAENQLYLVGRAFSAVGVDSMAEARDLLFDMGVPLRISALNRIALHQARQADFSGARDTLNVAREHAEDHYNGVMLAQSLVSTAMTMAVVGNEAGALDALAQADLELSGPVGDGEWKYDQARTMALAVRDAIENGKAAEEAVKKAGFPGDRNMLLIMKTMALIRLSRTEAAAETLAFAALNGDQERSHSFPIATGYAILADRQAVLGDRAGAERSARRALFIAENMSPPSEDRIMAMYFSVVALARVGRLDLALSAAPLIHRRKRDSVE